MHRYPASGIGPLYNRYRYGIGLIGPFISGTLSGIYTKVSGIENMQLFITGNENKQRSVRSEMRYRYLFTFLEMLYV